MHGEIPVIREKRQERVCFCRKPSLMARSMIIFYFYSWQLSEPFPTRFILLVCILGRSHSTGQFFWFITSGAFISFHGSLSLRLKGVRGRGAQKSFHMIWSQPCVGWHLFNHDLHNWNTSLVQKHNTIWRTNNLFFSITPNYKGSLSFFVVRSEAIGSS